MAPQTFLVWQVKGVISGQPFRMSWSGDLLAYSHRPDPVQDTLDLDLVPGLAAAGGVALGVEVGGDAGERASGGLELAHAGDQVGVGFAGPVAVGDAGGPGAPGPGVVRQVAALGSRRSGVAGRPSGRRSRAGAGC